MIILDHKYYIDGDLFPKAVTGGAQVPYLYSRAFSDDLNFLMRHGVRHVDDQDRIYYVVPAPNTQSSVKSFWRELADLIQLLSAYL